MAKYLSKSPMLASISRMNIFIKYIFCVPLFHRDDGMTVNSQAGWGCNWEPAVQGMYAHVVVGLTIQPSGCLKRFHKWFMMH